MYNSHFKQIFNIRYYKTEKMVKNENHTTALTSVVQFDFIIIQ